MVWISLLVAKKSTQLISYTSKRSHISTIYSRREERLLQEKTILDGVAKQLQIHQISDWYKLQPKDFQDNIDANLWETYDKSPYFLLSSVYPEHDWLAWKFHQCPRNFWNSHKNQKKFLDWAFNQLKLQTMDDWYNISFQDLIKLGGGGLLKKHGNSPSKLLSSVYPNHNWLPWKFQQTHRHFWNDMENQHKYMQWAASQLNIHELDSWYKIEVQNLLDLGASGLLKKYNYSLSLLLSSIFPQYKWLPWKFNKCPQQYWDNKHNQLKFLEWSKRYLKIKNKNDWYNVTVQDITELGGGGLLMKYGQSPSKMLSEIYSDYDWLPWKFHQCPSHVWKEEKMQKKFVESAEKELGIKEREEWYKVTNQEIVDLGGAGLLAQYDNSMQKLLSFIFPEQEWLPWKFHQVNTNEWQQNAEKFLEKVANDLQIKEKKEWYNVTKDDIQKYEGGGSLLRAFNRSMYRVLTFVYPEYGWLPWRFPRPLDASVENNNWKVFFEWISKQLNVKNLDDWYKIKPQQVIELGGGVLFIQNHSLSQLLVRFYPENNWKFSSTFGDIWNDETCANYFSEWLQKQEQEDVVYVHRLIKNMNVKGVHYLTQKLSSAFPTFHWGDVPSVHIKRSQAILKECIQNLFKGEVLEEFKHPDINHLELDFYYPQYKLAFEYQGQQHYRNVNLFNRLKALDDRKHLDVHKSDICKDLGITLIEVPYWWDKKQASLAATVFNKRPDLFDIQPQGDIIPLSPPTSPVKPTNKKDVVRQVLMTATEWDTNMNPKGWYMTEKYDGMRLYWDGKKCYSRNGEEVTVPKEITSKLPSVSLDGELWTQYGLYQDAVSLVKSNNEAKWNKAIFWVFDTPELAHKPLEERIAFLKTLQLPQFAKIVDFVKCEGKEHLSQFASEIIAKNGEGVVLREPESLYKVGRSTSLRKHKPFIDTEVRVVKNNYPHGITCEQANGKEVFVNITEYAEDARRVKPGDVITVKHLGMNVYGTLQFPQYYRERLDVNWTDINKPSS